MEHMRYRFLHHWREFRAGDLLPEDRAEKLGSGMIATMLQRQRIAAVEEGAKMIDAPAESKMIEAPPVTKRRKHAHSS